MRRCLFPPILTLRTFLLLLLLLHTLFLILLLRLLLLLLLLASSFSSSLFFGRLLLPCLKICPVLLLPFLKNIMCFVDVLALLIDVILLLLPLLQFFLLLLLLAGSSLLTQLNKLLQDEALPNRPCQELAVSAKLGFPVLPSVGLPGSHMHSWLMLSNHPIPRPLDLPTNWKHFRRPYPTPEPPQALTARKPQRPLSHQWSRQSGQQKLHNSNSAHSSGQKERRGNDAKNSIYHDAG